MPGTQPHAAEGIEAYRQQVAARQEIRRQNDAFEKRWDEYLCRKLKDIVGIECGLFCNNEKKPFRVIAAMIPEHSKRDEEVEAALGKKALEELPPELREGTEFCWLD